ncbi:MAG TPA: hypothetical protein VIK03_07110 [Thermoleophilia bacterium]
MNCIRCQTQTHLMAPFCPVCGADPAVGADWLATSHLVVDAGGEPVLPNGGRSEGANFLELSTLAVYEASRIAAAEAALGEAIAHDQPEGQRDQALEQAAEEAIKQVLRAQPLLRDAASDFAVAVEQGRLAAEVFPHSYSEAAWALEEYGAYIAELSDDELRDVLWRRSITLLARRRLGDLTTFEAPDGSFALSYDRAVLSPLPDDFTEVRNWLMATFGGHEGSFGDLALALFPAAWRGWQDSAMAPWSGVLVFVRDNPLAVVTCDEHDWQGSRAGACEHYGKLLESSEWKVDAVKPATICGLPAVRTQSFTPLEDGTSGLIDNVWVRGPAHIYTLIVWAPDQREELARAVYGALGGFAPAGCSAARDARPAESDREQARPGLSLVPPLDADEDAGDEGQG